MANLRNCVSHLLLFAMGCGGHCIRMRSAVDAPLWVATYTLLAAGRDGRLFRNSHETNAVIVMPPGGKFSLGPRLANCTKKQFCSLTDENDNPIWHGPGGALRRNSYADLFGEGALRAGRGERFAQLLRMLTCFPWLDMALLSVAVRHRGRWRRSGDKLARSQTKTTIPSCMDKGGHFEKVLRMSTLLDMVARWRKGRR